MLALLAILNLVILQACYNYAITCFKVLIVSIIWYTRLDKVLLTNDCKIDGEIPCWSCAKIHSTAVNAFIVQLDSIKGKRSWFRYCHKVSSRSEDFRVWPSNSLVESSTSYIETKTRNLGVRCFVNIIYTSLKTEW